jgi:hypothetical protein
MTVTVKVIWFQNFAYVVNGFVQQQYAAQYAALCIKILRRDSECFLCHVFARIYSVSR